MEKEVTEVENTEEVTEELDLGVEEPEDQIEEE